MAGQNVVDLGYDIEKLSAQQQVVVEYLTKTLALAEQLDGRKIAPDISGQKGLTDAFTKQSKVVDELQLNIKEYNAILTQTATAQAKQNALSSEAAEKLAAEKEALRQRNAEVKNTAVLNQAAEGSINQMKAALAQLTAQYDKMSAAERNSASGKELQLKINGQVEALKKLEAETGRYQRNVGNYTGAVKILEKALIEVRQKIDDNTNSGNTNSESMAKLQTEEQLLSSVLEKNQKGFASLTMEVRANERALATMAAEGMQNSEAFQALQQKIASAQRELKEFKDTQKLFAAEMPGVAAATIAAKGLAGAYAIGAGATSLFANGNEKVEKELQKLVAIMTILQGLNEVHELLEKRLAIAKIFSAGGTAIQTAALRVYAFATESATFATKAFRAALISTGLGAILILLTSFTNSMVSAKEATDEGAESIKDYDKALQDLNEDLEISNKIIEANTEKSKERVKQRAGSEAEISKLSSKAIQDEINQRIEYNKKIPLLLEDLHRDRMKLIFKGGEEAEKQVKELNKKEENLLKEQNKNVFTIMDLGFKLTNEAEKEKTRLADESRKSIKASSEAGIVDLETTQLKLKKITSDERQSYANRIAAVNEFYNIQKDIENKKTSISLSTPNLTSGEIQKIKAENKKALTEIDISRKSEEKNLLDQKRERYLTAENNIANSRAEIVIDGNKRILENENSSSLDRLRAIQSTTEQQLIIENNAYGLKISKSGLTNEELEAMAVEHERNLTNIKFKGDQDRLNEQIKAANEQASKAKVRIDTSALLAEMNGLQRLHELYINGKLSVEDYAKAKEKLANSTLLESLKNEEQALLKLMAQMGHLGKDTDAIYKSILDNQKHQQDIVNGTEEKDLQTKKEKFKQHFEEVAQIASKSVALIGEAMSASFTEQKNQVQDVENSQQEGYEKEVERIKNSTLSEQDKANKLKILESQRQADKEKNAREQKRIDIEKAKMDKDIAILNIIINTATAVVKAMPNIPLAIATGVLGAAELAIAASAPLPKYAEGTDNHPGGFAMVGEGSKPELVTTPGGNSFIADKAMILDLPAGTTVEPFSTDDINQVMYQAMLKKQSRIFGMADDQERRKLGNGELGSKIDQMNRNVVKAIKEQKQASTVVNNNINLGWANYIQKEIYN